MNKNLKIIIPILAISIIAIVTIVLVLMLTKKKKHSKGPSSPPPSSPPPSSPPPSSPPPSSPPPSSPPPSSPPPSSPPPSSPPPSSPPPSSPPPSSPPPSSPPPSSPPPSSPPPSSPPPSSPPPSSPPPSSPPPSSPPPSSPPPSSPPPSSPPPSSPPPSSPPPSSPPPSSPPPSSPPPSSPPPSSPPPSSPPPSSPPPSSPPPSSPPPSSPSPPSSPPSQRENTADCRDGFRPSSLIKVGDTGCSKDEDCCCIYQKCEKSGESNRCVGEVPRPKTNQKIMTHYWDCGKPSCSWPGKNGTPTSYCNLNDLCKPILGPSNEKSVVNGGNATTCKTQYPKLVKEGNETILYGYAATSGYNKNDPPSKPCGTCYELTFSNARKIDKARVMITNGGDSDEGNFDFMVPGGGFGQYDGCTKSKYGGWNPAAVKNDSTPYGGFHHENDCSKAFPGDKEAEKACREILFGVWEQLGCNQGEYPGNIFIESEKQIKCPEILMKNK